MMHGQQNVKPQLFPPNLT